MTTTQADRATFTLRSAAPDDCEALVRLIGALAEYEKLTHLMQATPEALRAVLFGPRPYGEAVVAEVDGRAVGFALFFHNVSTFLCKPGLYLEDLFVEPAWRGHGIGKALLVHVARLARSGTAAASNGACWTGTHRPSPSTKRWAPTCCPTGASAAPPATRSPGWPRYRCPRA